MRNDAHAVAELMLSFSALQRAENSSIVKAATRSLWRKRVSVLFSEPKIPQAPDTAALRAVVRVSVLFSEPKIPQVANAFVASLNSIVSVLFSEPKIPQ